MVDKMRTYYYYPQMHNSKVITDRPKRSKSYHRIEDHEVDLDSFSPIYRHTNLS